MENQRTEEEFNTVETNASGLSDTEEELEEYDPMPYAFVLKDAYRRPLMIPPDKLYMARITSPPFYTLLDHVVAVLWCFYSRAGHNKLGTSQLHWAIKFLEGLHDKRNKYTPDVSMVTEDLEEALVEVAANLNEEEISKRKYEERFESVRQVVPESPSYGQFSRHLKEGYNLHGSFLVDHEDTEQTNILNDSSVYADYSIVLKDLLEDDPNALSDIMNSSKMEDEAGSTTSRSVRLKQSPLSVTANEDIFMRRNSLMESTIRQLEEIKKLDETIRDMC